MAYVVTENCVDCRFTDCVDVCPVDCFYADDKMVYIHPDECIDCGACEFACPVRAIFAEDDLPDEMQKWQKINAERVLGTDIVQIVESVDPLPTAEAKRAKLGL